MERALKGREGSCGCADTGSSTSAHCCCEMVHLVHVIGRKYAMPVVNLIGSGADARFSGLQQTLGVSSSSLADTLHELERVGLVLRLVIPDSPPGSMYLLTTAGQALHQHFRAFLEAVRKTE